MRRAPTARARHDPSDLARTDRVTVLAGTIAPVFGVMAAGFVAVRLRLLGPVGVRRLVLFVFNGTIPVMLFYRIGTLALPEEIEWTFLLAYYGSAFATYGAGMAVGRFGFRRPVEEQAIFGLGAGFSNTVLLGIPLLVTAFGPEATLPVFLIIAFHSATLLPVTVIFLKAGRAGGDGPTGARIGRLLFEIFANPVIIGILLGFTANAAGLVLPRPVALVAQAVSAISIPASLVALGASLAGYRLRGRIAPASALAGLKLLVHPLIAWVLTVPILGLGAPWAPVAVVMAGMPTGAMVYLFGARYDTAADVAAATVAVTAAASVVTLSALLLLMGA
jgi:malonate transporter